MSEIVKTKFKEYDFKAIFANSSKDKKLTYDALCSLYFSSFDFEIIKNLKNDLENFSRE